LPFLFPKIYAGYHDDHAFACIGCDAGHGLLYHKKGACQVK